MKLLALAATLMIVGFAAGCGGAADDQATPAASNFADCLRQQGIELPTGRPSGFPTARPSGFPTARPSGGGGFPGGGQGPGGVQRPAGVDEQTWQKALEACGSLRPSRGTFGRQSPGAGGALTAYLNCLSEHGVTYSPGQTLPDDAKVCEVLRPSGTGRP